MNEKPIMTFIASVFDNKTITEFRIGNAQWIIEERKGKFTNKIIRAIEKILKTKKKTSIVINYQKIEDDKSK